MQHWPCPFVPTGDPTQNLFPRDPADNSKVHLDTKTSVVDTWKAMIKLLSTGKVKTIGVSNFDQVSVGYHDFMVNHSTVMADLLLEQIDALIAATGVAPSVHQIERHPLLIQPELVAHHKALNM